MKLSYLFPLTILILMAMSGCSSNQDVQITLNPTQDIHSNPTPAPATSIDQGAAIRQKAENAQRICLEMDQSNPEAEPNFTQDFSDYIRYFLIQLGKDIITPGNPCDITLNFNLAVEPLGGEYQGVEGICYTGADITGEIFVTSPEYEPLLYPVQWNDPVTEGVITTCPTKQEAPFFMAYADEMLPVLSDLWGTPIYVYALVKDIEFKSIGSISLGPTIELNVQGSRGFIEERIQASGKGAVPGLTVLLSDKNDAIRYGAISLLYSVAEQADEAIPVIIEMLDDPFVVLAEVEGYEDLYPIRLAAYGTLVKITGLDWGYDKDRWYQALNITPISPNPASKNEASN